MDRDHQFIVDSLKELGASHVNVITRNRPPRVEFNWKGEEKSVRMAGVSGRKAAMSTIKRVKIELHIPIQEEQDMGQDQQPFNPITIVPTTPSEPEPVRAINQPTKLTGKCGVSFYPSNKSLCFKFMGTPTPPGIDVEKRYKTSIIDVNSWKLIPSDSGAKWRQEANTNAWIITPAFTELLSLFPYGMRKTDAEFSIESDCGPIIVKLTQQPQTGIAPPQPSSPREVTQQAPPPPTKPKIPTRIFEPPPPERSFPDQILLTLQQSLADPETQRAAFKAILDGMKFIEDNSNYRFTRERTKEGGRILVLQDRIE